jgi:quinol monooxygenase YgiN
MYLAILKLKPQLGKQQEMLDILQSVEDQTRLECRCIVGGVFVQSLEEVSILYLEQWSSKEDLYRHIQSPLYRWVLSAMELSCEPPEISFHEVTRTYGMDLIESLRLAHK